MINLPVLEELSLSSNSGKESCTPICTLCHKICLSMLTIPNFIFYLHCVFIVIISYVKTFNALKL